MSVSTFMRNLLTSLGVTTISSTLFAVAPTSSGFSTLEGDSSVSIQLDGGDPRVRADQLTVSTRVSVVFLLEPNDYAYWRAFYRTSTKNGTMPFTLPLMGIDDEAYHLYTVRIVGGTLKWPQIQGPLFTVAMDLWVTPLNDTSEDASIIAAYIG